MFFLYSNSLSHSLLNSNAVKKTIFCKNSTSRSVDSDLIEVPINFLWENLKPLIDPINTNNSVVNFPLRVV